jgi:hypothetical protein
MGGFLTKCTKTKCDEGCHYCHGKSLVGRLQVEWTTENKVQYQMDITSELTHTILIVIRSSPFDEVVIQEHHDFLSAHGPPMLFDLLDRNLWTPETSLKVDLLLHSVNGHLPYFSKVKQGWNHYTSLQCQKDQRAEFHAKHPCAILQRHFQNLAQNYLQIRSPHVRPLPRIEAR